LDSAPITAGRASTQLGYDLRRRHTAAVLWTDPRHPDQAALAAAAEALGPATRARQVLTVIASSSSVWAWLATAADTAAAACTPPPPPAPPSAPRRPASRPRSGSLSARLPPGPTGSGAATSTRSLPSG